MQKYSSTSGLPLAPLTLTAREVRQLQYIASTTTDDAHFTFTDAGPSRQLTPPPLEIAPSQDLSQPLH